MSVIAGVRNNGVSTRRELTVILFNSYIDYLIKFIRSLYRWLFQGVLVVSQSSLTWNP